MTTIFRGRKISNAEHFRFIVSGRLPAPLPEGRRKGTRFPFITAAARSLGVDRVGLYRVLKKQHPDRRNLHARYAAFVKKQGRAR